MSETYDIEELETYGDERQPYQNVEVIAIKQPQTNRPQMQRPRTVYSPVMQPPSIYNSPMPMQQQSSGRESISNFIGGLQQGFARSQDTIRSTQTKMRQNLDENRKEMQKAFSAFKSSGKRRI